VHLLGGPCEALAVGDGDEASQQIEIKGPHYLLAYLMFQSRHFT
jgi:hypothetical protein